MDVTPDRNRLKPTHGITDHTALQACVDHTDLKLAPRHVTVGVAPGGNKRGVLVTLPTGIGSTGLDLCAHTLGKCRKVGIIMCWRI